MESQTVLHKLLLRRERRKALIWYRRTGCRWQTQSTCSVLQLLDVTVLLRAG
jgi:hypothetical protein